MATPAGLLLASPPVISGVAAMAACAAMAVFYVAVLYAPTVILRFPPPTSLRTFLHRRFACAAVASAASVLATASLLRVWSLSDFADMFAVFGIRKDHLIQAVAIPLLLTSLVYAGSFVARVWLLVSSWGGGDEVEIGCAQRLAQWIQAAVADVMVWRNYVVAPFTEELVFRACMIPLLLCGGFKMSTIIFLSPIFFSLGNLLCPIIAHVFCNMMGLPVFSSPRTKGAALVAFLAGSIAFFWLLFPATSPELYNSSFDRCSCWHGFCNWK
ncbi:CAAX prenyl protease 2 isoform X3 [Zea mays]|uniref:intramembrane prenyl-peptidase Rce1 n=1 Tax=Zea mays TaxID=4577 RepID=A0A804PZC3_MAIZE|nr:CAAX prenyl protease 2 isoform X3 [Zea mays]|eukprot:XP_023155993.1 CAAX prenyl protease 2 isoform X3 [Zea mays]